MEKLGLKVAVAVTLAMMGGEGMVSAAEQSVVLGSCTYTISVPSGSTIWNVGSTGTIQWFKAGTCSQRVDLDLWRDGQRVTSIATNQQSNGIYNWSLPSYLRTALEYRVRVRDRDDQYSEGYSQQFTILNPRYCGFRITVPGAGDSWQRGGLETIRWNRAGTCTSPVDLHLLRNGAQIAEIAIRTSDVGTFNWTVPEQLVEGGGYAIRIRDSNDHNSYDVSDPFTIGESASPCSYGVTNPRATSVWHLGEERAVTWRSEGECGARVDLDLLLAGEQVEEIAEGLLDGGSYVWSIPTTLELSSEYAVRVSSDDDGSIFDVSETFSIQEPIITDRTYWLDAAAKISGQAGSQWRTDLALKNSTVESADVEIRLMGDGSGSLNTAVAGGSQRAFEDLLGLMGVEGKGWLQVVSSQPLVASGRIYNQGDAGSYGQFVAGVEEGGGLDAGSAGYLIQLRQSVDAFRTNLLVTNTSDAAAAVRITLYDSAGTDLISYRVNLDPHGQFHDLAPFERRAERPDLGWGFAGVEVLEGASILVSASVIDSRTNDATTIPIAVGSGP